MPLRGFEALGKAAVANRSQIGGLFMAEAANAAGYAARTIPVPSHLNNREFHHRLLDRTITATVIRAVVEHVSLPPWQLLCRHPKRLLTLSLPSHRHGAFSDHQLLRHPDDSGASHLNNKQFHHRLIGVGFPSPPKACLLRSVSAMDKWRPMRGWRLRLDWPYSACGRTGFSFLKPVSRHRPKDPRPVFTLRRAARPANPAR